MLSTPVDLFCDQGHLGFSECQISVCDNQKGEETFKLGGGVHSRVTFRGGG